jgi:ribA/ribD-fused uncharacterized protein
MNEWQAYAVHEDGKIFGFFGPFRFLSNYHIIKESPGICLGELYFPTTEHAYQAAKWPENLRSQFLDLSPSEAKRRGSEAPGFNARKWNKMKYDLMYELNWQKFHNFKYLRDMLMETDGYQLEERNHWGDQDWGTNAEGVGENNLGKILMRIRDKLFAMQRNDEF